MARVFTEMRIRKPPTAMITLPLPNYAILNVISQSGTLTHTKDPSMFIHRGRTLTIPFVFLLVTLLLAACGGTGTQQAQKQPVTPTPTPGQGQQLLKIGRAHV